MIIRTRFWPLAGLLILTACSAPPSDYYRSSPDVCDGAPSCVIPAIAEAVIHAPKSTGRCEDLPADKRRQCQTEIEAIKESIKNGSKQAVGISAAR